MREEFEFGWAGAAGKGCAFGEMHVVEFIGEEAMSSLYRYELTLLSRSPATAVDPHDLILSLATLRITTGASPGHRVVHGIVTEAEELGPARDGILYRVVVAPPIARAAYRKGCRIFLDKTLRQIVESVLQADPNVRLAPGGTVEDDEGGDFATFAEKFTWRIADSSRLDDPQARAYTVQYNESDLAFVSRLLEDEGIGYHFEHGEGICLMVLSDRDGGRMRLRPFQPLRHGAGGGLEVSAVRLGARARTRVVTLDDYSWKNPTLDLVVEAKTSGQDGALSEYSYPGGFTGTAEQGRPIVAARLDRYEIEARYATMQGTARLLGAGSIFALEHSEERYEGEYLVTRLTVRGSQRGALAPGAASGADELPFTFTAECARRGAGSATVESRFRPALVTPRPRIAGAQTAFVTADPSTPDMEIHVDSLLGRVRLRFHWDRDAERLAKEPSSAWVRVSQPFAGVGEGGVWHPRVGVEVIVEFEGGDPDRPVVVGRLYNGANLPPTTGATDSVIKSFASPGGGVYNSIGFSDAAGSEGMNFHAGRDLNQNVGNDRAETVASNASSGVGANRSESTGSNRSTAVGANNDEAVGANESRAVGANQTSSVGANQTNLVGANQSTDVGANQETNVGADQTVNVGASQTVGIGAGRALTIGAGDTIDVGADQSITVGAAQTLSAGASQAFDAPVQTFTCDLHTITASAILTGSAGGVATLQAPLTVAEGQAILILSGGALTVVTAATVNINGGTIAIDGGAVSVTGGTVAIDGGNVDVSGGTVNVSGGSIAVSAGEVTIDGGGMLDASAGLIKLN